MTTPVASYSPRRTDDDLVNQNFDAIKRALDSLTAQVASLATSVEAALASETDTASLLASVLAANAQSLTGDDDGEPWGQADLSATKQNIKNPVAFYLQQNASNNRFLELYMIRPGVGASPLRTVLKVTRVSNLAGTAPPFGASVAYWLENSAGVAKEFAQVAGQMAISTAGAEEGLIGFYLTVGGAAEIQIALVNKYGFLATQATALGNENFALPGGGGMFSDGVTNYLSDGAGLTIGSTTLGGGTDIGFLGKAATPHVPVGLGATLTNNITAGGTANTLTNWTNLVTYATDAAAIRNAVYQLGLKLANIEAEMKAFGPYIT